jgi:hypothetical protein
MKKNFFKVRKKYKNAKMPKTPFCPATIDSIMVGGHPR